MALELPPPNPYSRDLDAAGVDPNSSYANILALAGSPATLLDVGCNTGYLGKLFLENGAKVWGIDVDRSAAEEAQAAGLEVAVSDLDTQPLGEAFPGLTFDAIVFADVLEHLKHPERVLRAARDLLNDGGQIFVSMPNVAHGNVRLDLLLGRFRYSEIGLLDHTHLRFFTDESLAALFAESGFTVRELRRVMSTVDSSRIAEAVKVLGLPPEAPGLLRLLSDDAAQTFQYVVAAAPSDGPAEPVSFRTLGDAQSDEPDRLAYLSVAAVPNVVADMQDVIDGLQGALDETRSYLDQVIVDKDEVIRGREASLAETRQYLDTVIHDYTDLVSGLEASLREERAHFSEVLRDREAALEEFRRRLDDEQRRYDELTLPTVTVVVVNWNGQHLIGDCLTSLRNQAYPRRRFQVVVVDNGSSDHSVREIRREFPDVTLIEAGANLGFAAGNNLAIARSDSDYVALLNNDAAADPDWLLNLVRVAESDPTIAAVNSKIWLTNDRLTVEVEVSDVFVPGEHDPRRLGAPIGSEVLLGDAIPNLEYLRGAFGPEANEHGPFRWLSASGLVRVPIVDPAATEAVLRLFPVRFPSEKQPTVTFRTGAEELMVPLPADAPVDVRLALTPDAVRPVVQNAGSLVLPDGAGSDRGTVVVGTDVFYETDQGQFDRIEDVPAFCGAAVLLRRRALDEVGPFDPSFFMYYEDTDLSLRLRRAGWRIVVEPRSTVRHQHAASSVEWSPRFCYYTERNRLLMLLKNSPLPLAAKEWLRYTARALRVQETAENRKRFLSVERSLVRHLPGLLRTRRQHGRAGYVPVSFRDLEPGPAGTDRPA